MHGPLNIKLDITVLILVEIYRKFSKYSNKVCRFCCEEKPGPMKSKDLTFLVRKKMVPCIQNLAQQG
jgi:hypothetical protein